MSSPAVKLTISQVRQGLVLVDAEKEKDITGTLNALRSLLENDGSGKVKGRADAVMLRAVRSGFVLAVHAAMGAGAKELAGCIFAYPTGPGCRWYELGTIFVWPEKIGGFGLQKVLMTAMILLVYALDAPAEGFFAVTNHNPRSDAGIIRSGFTAENIENNPSLWTETSTDPTKKIFTLRRHNVPDVIRNFQTIWDTPLRLRKFDNAEATLAWDIPLFAATVRGQSFFERLAQTLGPCDHCGQVPCAC